MTLPETGNESIAVLCVDDNPRIASALRTQFSRTDGFEWVGWLADAGALLEQIGECHANVVLMDLDMPGKDPIEVMAAIAEQRPDVRTIVFSGLVGRELIDRVIESGAWGYASKNDGEDGLVDVIRRVVAGEFAMSHEVWNTWSA